MRMLVSSIWTGRRCIRAVSLVLAVSLVGASPNPYPNLARADRVASPADCRLTESAGSIDCLGVVLPMTAGEVLDVVPGLSVVDQVPG
jgi:hypothetical protein